MSPVLNEFGRLNVPRTEKAAWERLRELAAFGGVAALLRC